RAVGVFGGRLRRVVEERVDVSAHAASLASGPRQARRSARLPLRERGVRLGGDARFRFHADAAADRELVPNVNRVLPQPGTGHEDHARSVAGADEAVLGPRRAVQEVPLLQEALLALDDRGALAREDEEVLLVHLAVIAPSGLAGLEHPNRVAELREGRLL